MTADVRPSQILAAMADAAARVKDADPGDHCTDNELEQHALRLRGLGAFVIGLLDADGRL